MHIFNKCKFSSTYNKGMYKFPNSHVRMCIDVHNVIHNGNVNNTHLASRNCLIIDEASVTKGSKVSMGVFDLEMSFYNSLNV